MAVQAQYPSNILLNRNGQEGRDYSLQPQPGTLFLDQSSSMIFNNVGASTNNNPRKRGREASISTPKPVSTNISTVHQQQIIDISQLHNSNQQLNVVSTGLRLSSDQQQQLTHTSSSSLYSLLATTEDFASQIKQQRDEVEQFLQAQGDQLRRTLADKRRRHYRALLCAAEESMVRRLREKETEVEKATRQNAELETRAARLSVEAQLWQAKARAQEATAASLQARLQQATVVGPPAQDNDGALSCAGEAGDAESGFVDPERVVAGFGPSCRWCRKRVASVVVLPCRHLSVCTECDRVIKTCPACHTVKNSSVEVFLS